MDTNEAPQTTESPPIVELEPARAPEIDRHAARRIKLKMDSGAILTGQERELYDAYKRAHPRPGRPPGKKNKPKLDLPHDAPAPAPQAAPAPGGPQVVDFSAGAVGAPAQGATPSPQTPTAPAATCGDPNCVSCARGLKTCPVSGKPIYPRISLEAAATFSGMLLGGVAMGIKIAFKGDVTAPSAEEITRMAPAMQELVWRRFAEAEEYSDIAAVLGITVAFGFSRAHEAIASRKEAEILAGAPVPKAAEGAKPPTPQPSPAPSAPEGPVDTGAVS